MTVYVDTKANLIVGELASLRPAERADVLLQLVGSLVAEAAVLVGREQVAEAIYAIGDIVVGEASVPR